MTTAAEAELRSVVRELLRELIPSSRATSNAPLEVRLDDDADLRAFVSRLIGLLDEPGTGAQLRAGTLRFTKRSSANVPPTAAPAPPKGLPDAPSAVAATPVIHVEKGAVTERLVNQAAADGARITLGKRAVLTPLARESARRAGIELERRSC